MNTIHGTSVLISGAGVLLRGKSGAGKSDLALRLIDRGAVLIADDRVEVRVDHGKVMASAPATLAGLLEVRGVGLMRVPFAPAGEVHLVVDLVTPETVERLPEAEWTALAETRLPRLALAPFEASAPAKIRLAAAAAARGDPFGQIPVLT
ncbi:MAG: HPr kinase/phosphatase C-terminal domain-containing protein [Rhodospirillaceae bacterium]